MQIIRNFAESGRELSLRSKRMFIGLTLKCDFTEILNCYCDSNSNITVNSEIYIRNLTVNLIYIICFEGLYHKIVYVV